MRKQSKRQETLEMKKLTSENFNTMTLSAGTGGS